MKEQWWNGRRQANIWETKNKAPTTEKEYKNMALREGARKVGWSTMYMLITLPKGICYIK